jgi:MFS transporter, YQGE family, putative transporter
MMRIWGKTGRLDRAAWLLLLVSGLFAIATALSGSFVNVYLWKIKHKWSLIAQFHLIHFLVSSLTFLLVGWLMKRMDRVVAMRLGMVFLSLFYLTVLLLGMRSVYHVMILGTLLGLGAGFFWLAYNVLYFEITEKENRDRFNGVNGLIYSVSGMVAPLLSGLVITRIDHFTGYRIIFAISLLVFVLAVLVSFLFKQRSARGEYGLIHVLRQIKEPNQHWCWVNLAMISQGLREGVFTFLIGLLVYIITKSELTLGGFFTISSLASMISFYWIGRFLETKDRNRYIFIGGLMMGLVGVPFVLLLNSWTVFVFGIGIALFYPLYMVPLTSTVFDVIGENRANVELRVEYVVARELALNLGRMMGILLFMGWVAISSDLQHIRWFILLLGFVQVFTWLSIRQVPILQNPSTEQAKKHLSSSS